MTLDSRTAADRTALTHTTGGGAIVLGGGSATAAGGCTRAGLAGALLLLSQGAVAARPPSGRLRMPPGCGPAARCRRGCPCSGGGRGSWLAMRRSGCGAAKSRDDSSACSSSTVGGALSLGVGGRRSQGRRPAGLLPRDSLLLVAALPLL